MNLLAGYPRLSEAELALDEGRYEVAAQHLIQHLREHPGEPRGMSLLGRAALKTGALVQAEQFLRQVWARGYRSIDVQRDLASALNQQERLTEALAAFAHIETQISDPEITAVRASILAKLGRHEDALDVRRRLTEAYPDNPSFCLGLGHSLRSMGRTDEAIAAYRRATQIDTERGEAWWALADIKSRVLTDEDMATIERMLGIAVDLLNVVPLHFALARAWHDRSNYAKAFAHYDEGNRLSRDALEYTPEHLTAEIDEFIRLFDASCFSPAAAPQPKAPVPIFILSLPRSGSTLLEQMLDRHSEIEALGELPYIRALVLAAHEIHTRHEKVRVPELILNLNADEAAKFGEDYLNRAQEHRRTNSTFFIDKMPMNWSDILFINRILPQAKFIDLRRNPLDCCFSNFVHYFSRAHSSSFGLGDLGRSYVDYSRLMDHLANVVPGLIHTVRYEELVEEPERVLRGTLDYLDLPWDEALLTFYESDRTVRTPSAEQVRRPLNRSGIGTWRPYAEWLGPLREALGPLADA